MAYATLSELQELLPQAASTDDPLLTTVLDRATAIVNGVLGFSFTTYGTVATTKDVRATGGYWLELPYYKTGSLTTVSQVSGRGLTSEALMAITGFVKEDDGRLYYDSGWTAGTWYRVTAIWGYGEPPEDVVQVTLEIAVNLWRGRDRGMYSDVIGAEGGGAVGYQRALTNAQKMILANVRTTYLGVVHA